MGATCEMELEAHGEFETTSALHTYFNVGDIAAVKVSGLGDRLIDKVNDAKEDVLADGIQTFPDRTDRVYLNPEACSVIHDDALNRNIDVVHHHHLNVVGWNPGPALSVSMGDMPDDGYKTFVCVETAYATAPQKTTEENRLAWRRLSELLNAKTALRIMPDAANALSGLQTARSRRPDKRSAIRQISASCRMRLTPYPAYKPPAIVGLISAAPSGKSGHIQRRFAFWRRICLI